MRILNATGCALLLAGLATGGCTEGPEARPSGFLKDYSQLRPSEDFPGAKIYKHPTKKPKDFDKFIIDPVVVHFAPDARGTKIDPRRLEILTTYFRDEITKALTERFQPAEKPGPGVLRVRAALTDIRPRTHTWDVRPSEAPTYPGGATIEVEAVDSESGERILAILDALRGEVVSLEEREEFEDVKLALRRAVERVGRLIRAEYQK